jgi:hypothetical protein
MTRPRQMRREVHKGRAAIGAMMLLIALSGGGQSAPTFPRQTKRVPLKTYANDVLGFELSYPSSYRREDPQLPSHLAQWAKAEGWHVLLHATTGKGKAQCDEGGECDKFGRLIVALDLRHFDLATIGQHYEHMGWFDAVPFRVGVHTFYYIGPGGGGVTYPDTFFYNLHGHILIIEFDGPYPPDRKSPSDAVKSFERVVLGSFHLRGNPQPHK